MNLASAFNGYPTQISWHSTNQMIRILPANQTQISWHSTNQMIRILQANQTQVSWYSANQKMTTCQQVSRSTSKLKQIMFTVLFQWYHAYLYALDMELGSVPFLSFSSASFSKVRHNVSFFFISNLFI